MRVCFFSRLVSDHARGGLQSDLDNRARWLRRRGHDVVVLTTAHPTFTGVRARGGVDLHFVAGTRPEKQDRRWRSKSTDKFLELHRTQPFDLVVTMGGGGWQYARLRSKNPELPPLAMLMQSPLLWNLSASLRRPGPLNLARSVRSFYYLACWNRRYGRFVDRVLVLSESSRLASIAEGSFHEDLIHVIPNGIDTELFQPGHSTEALRKALGIELGDPVAIWIGRYKREKGWRETLAAASLLRERLPRFKLILVISHLRSGRGQLMEAIHSLRLESTVRIVEDVPHSELPSYFQLAKLLLAPLHGPEGQPLVLIEAMSCGLPVVASSIESVTDIVDGECGILLADFKNPGRLAGAAARFLEDEGARNRAGEAARKRVLARFDERVTSERTVRLLESMGERTRADVDCEATELRVSI